MASNNINILQILNNMLAKKYEINDLDEVKRIIGWQITRDAATHTMKIDQLAFIRDLVIEKRLVKCNANVISIKARLAIKMLNSNNYNKINFYKYEYLIKKSMYLPY